MEKLKYNNPVSEPPTCQDCNGSGLQNTLDGTLCSSCNGTGHE